MTQKLGRMRDMPHFCGFHPDICLTTEEKARKNLSQSSHTWTYNKNFALSYKQRIYLPLLDKNVSYAVLIFYIAISYLPT